MVGLVGGILFLVDFLEDFLRPKSIVFIKIEFIPNFLLAWVSGGDILGPRGFSFLAFFVG